jgi:hypothetical protein
MLSIVLISIVVVAVVFAVVNKFTKKQEQQPTIPTIEEEPLGYETSSICEVVERELPPVGSTTTTAVEEEPLVLAKPAKKPKAKMSAKPKAPKKKKNA